MEQFIRGTGKTAKFDFNGRTALITGAAVGIGRAVALEMGKAGATLILLDIDMENLEKVKAELDSVCKVLIYRCDISDKARVDEVVADAISKVGDIHVLVNNAALWREWCPFAESDMDVWKRYFDINVSGTAYVTKAVLPCMMKNRYGRIINVASIAGVYGNVNMVCYSATKGALIAFTKALAKEMSEYNVLVNAVSPGSVSASENHDIDSFQPSELAFLGRTGTDRENASLICFLASEEASYISGQNIQIDGCRKRQ